MKVDGSKDRKPKRMYTGQCREQIIDSCASLVDYFYSWLSLAPSEVYALNEGSKNGSFLDAAAEQLELFRERAG